VKARSVHIVVKGRVQGVGYRYFVLNKAIELHINGWVKNLPNGDVEIEAHSESTNIKTFIDWLKIGPSMSDVKSININDIQTGDDIPDKFTVRY